MFGTGLLKGLYVTAKRFLRKKVTQQYPDVLPDLPQRSHGSFAFEVDKCIACNICANACPNGVIKVDYYKNEKGKKVLENYRMNLSYCMFCGLCVESCPRNAIYFKTDFDLSCFHKTDTIHSWKGNSYKDDFDTNKDVPVKTVQEKLGVQ